VPFSTKVVKNSTRKMVKKIQKKLKNKMLLHKLTVAVVYISFYRYFQPLDQLFSGVDRNDVFLF